MEMSGMAAGGSGHDAGYQIAGDAGEAHVEALDAEVQALVVETEEVEHGGVEVVDVDLAFYGAESEVVGGSVDAVLHAAATTTSTPSPCGWPAAA